MDYPHYEGIRLTSRYWGFGPAYVTDGRLNLPSYYNPCSDTKTRKECGHVSLAFWLEHGTEWPPQP